MPNYVTDGAIGIDLNTVASAVSSDLSKPGNTSTLGQTHEGNNNSEWIFVMATSAINPGALVAIETNNTVSALISTNMVSANRRIGFAQTTFAASTFGFVATRGNNILVRVVGAVSGGGGQPLYTTDTAGALSTVTNSASHFAIWNVYLKSSVSASASTAAAATASVSWPMREPATSDK